MASLHPLHPKSGWEMGTAEPGSSSSRNPARPAVGTASTVCRGDSFLLCTSSPSPLRGGSWHQRWWQWQGGEREPRCPRGCEEGELPAGLFGFSSIRGVTRDRAVPSCTLGVFCTPGASEGFCFVFWLLPALALPCTVRVSVWHCQEPPVPLPARVTPHLPSLCQTQCWLLAAKENIAVV